MNLDEKLRESIKCYGYLAKILHDTTMSAMQKSPEELLLCIKDINRQQDEVRRIDKEIRAALDMNFPIEKKPLVKEWYKAIEQVVEENNTCIPALRSQQAILDEELSKIQNGMQTLSAYNQPQPQSQNSGLIRQSS